MRLEYFLQIISDNSSSTYRKNIHFIQTKNKNIKRVFEKSLKIFLIHSKYHSLLKPFDKLTGWRNHF